MLGQKHCLIIGAGIAGLLAAHELQMHGVTVTVLEKSSGVGGRMATRYFEDARFDHGAQFITARETRFQNLITEWIAAGVVDKWSYGFASADGVYKADGHIRYRGMQGMTDIPKFLAQGLPIQLNQTVGSIHSEADKWKVVTRNGLEIEADALVLTPPVPQSLDLLASGNVHLPSETFEALYGLTYHPCFALMAVLDGESHIPEPGAVQINGDILRWIADNHRKGISPRRPTVTIHASIAFSHQHFETDRETIARILLEAAQEWIGAKVIGYQVHRWRYSEPVQIYPERFLAVESPAPLVFAGDIFGSARVEGAALSGLAAAEKILQLLTIENESR